MYSCFYCERVSMLAITGNAILVATEQQAPCFWGRGHGDSKNLLACLVSLHVCARITDPLWRSHATADCTCTGAWKCQWKKQNLMAEDHMHCLFGVVVFCCAIHRGLRESCAKDAIYCPSGGQDWKAMLPFHFTHYGPSWCVLPHIAGWKLRPHESNGILTQAVV